MKEERLVHRLEAFSDIVMGFVLAEMALTLVIPKSIPTPAGLLENISSFAVTFGLVAVLWYFHNRLFAIYFVPNALMVVLNFIMLGGLVVMGYVFSVAVRFIGTPGSSWLMGMWFECFGVVYGMLGIMYGIGVLLRARDLDPREFASGAFRAVAAVLASLLFAIVGYEFARVRHVSQLHGLMGMVAAFAALSLCARLLLRRWVASRSANA